MVQLNTFTFPDTPAPEETFLDLVLSALREKGLIPDIPPDLGLPSHISPANLEALVCVKEDGGWNYYLHFRDVPAGAANCIGMPEAYLRGSAVEAFLEGAAAVCRIVTGKPDLPFFAAGNRLMFTSYKPAAKADALETALASCFGR